MNDECVVTFKNKDRIIAMYFTVEGEDLNMQMTTSSELKEGEIPDLPSMLADAFLTALKKSENKDEFKSENPIIVS